MLILLNHYMIIGDMRYLHDNKWFGSQYNAFQDPMLCLQTKLNGRFNYIVLHCIVFYDVNLTISLLDRPITAEFTKGFP